MAFAEIIGEALFDPAGAIAELGKMERKAELSAYEQTIHQQTAGAGSGDVHVEMEYLVDFYNTLSELHAELAKQIVDLQHTADKMYAMPVGGQVVGVQKAWNTMTKMLGAHASGYSLTANLQAFDNEVIKCMEALNHNAQSYAANEQGAIEGFGRAAGTGHHKKKSSGKHTGSNQHATPAKPKSAPKSTPITIAGFGGNG